MNKNDLYILATFAREDKTNEMESLKISSLLENIENKYSHTKVREVIKDFKEQGLLKEGFKQGNSKTYFITNEGIGLLNKLNIDYKEWKI